ncbi:MULTISPECIES: hypothetical protein [unclassified Sphingomonas]|uniref:hypothetical protein n=1 Tax=unclassified Sphingomonas TaxID=196159 RepID=UPI00226A1FCE|nr:MULTISPECIES: hypothetical protein [unclassified Sphingomonas]
MKKERAQLAAELYAARRERDKIFGPARTGFGEPGWDMLLRLYVADAVQQKIPLTELVRAAGVDAEIATPYVQWMVSVGLALMSDNDETFGPVVALQAAGRTLMNRYLDSQGAGRASRTHLH